LLKEKWFQLNLTLRSRRREMESRRNKEERKEQRNTEKE
jgi:hypothetical protein